MSNLAESSPGDGAVLSAEDLVQISLYSKIIQCKSVSNFTIWFCSSHFYQHQEMLCQKFKSKLFIWKSKKNFAARAFS